jgi:hypothetical protein
VSLFGPDKLSSAVSQTAQVPFIRLVMNFMVRTITIVKYWFSNDRVKRSTLFQSNPQDKYVTVMMFSEVEQCMVLPALLPVK